MWLTFNKAQQCYSFFLDKEEGRNVMNSRSADSETKRLDVIDTVVGPQWMMEHMANNDQQGLLPLSRFIHPFAIKGWFLRSHD